MRTALALLCALALACAPEPTLPGPDLVARLGDGDVRHAEFLAYLGANVGENGNGLESEALSALFDQFLEERLLIELAVDRQVAVPGAAVVEAVSNLLEAEGTAPLTGSAIAGYYAEHTSDFRSPERVELRAIHTEARPSAERAQRELRNGADFGTVARRLSSDPTAELGGEQGELAHDELPLAFADAIFALAPNEISPILADAEGFYLFQVVRRVPERALAFDEVREEIVHRLAGGRADRAYLRFVADAESRYAVKVYDRNLPFVYRGRFPVERPYETQ